LENNILISLDDSKISIKDDFTVLAKLLNDSFAREFCCHEEEHKITGFIAIEKSSCDAGIFYIEKVAVHPDFRHKNIGKDLTPKDNRIRFLFPSPLDFFD
jgi:ribosomal protein S18 acetylase RimI-like enzyme